MVFYNDEVIRIEAAERRSRLLHEAALHRCRTTPTVGDRLLASLGDGLVALGERLRQRRTALHAALHPGLSGYPGPAQPGPAHPATTQARELAY